jgi:hypothetical protein
VRGGGEGGTEGGETAGWQREELDSMLLERKWGEGVRAELLAQKAAHQMESQNWRHPLARIAAIFSATVAGWRQRFWRD